MRHAAADLALARSPATRALRSYALVIRLRSAPGGLGHRPAGGFLAALLEALERDPTEADLETVAHLLDRAGTLLTRPDGDPLTLPGELSRLADRLPRARRPLPGEPDPVVPIESLLQEEPVPIEALAFPDPLALEPPDRTRLERSLSHYTHLVRTGAPVTPLAAITRRAHPLAAPPEVPQDDRVVPIEALLYAGPGALERAHEVRGELEATLRAASFELGRIEPLVRELLDLVPLALGDRR